MGGDNLVEYSVVHLQQNIEDDGYTEIERETLKGLEGSITKAISKSYTGFTVQPFEQGKVSYNTEIQIKYDRNPVTFKFNITGGTGVTSVTKKYGTPVTKEIVPDPVLEGAAFSFWSPDLPETFTENGYYTANWNFTSYTIQYWFQNIEDNDYSQNEAYPDKTCYGKIGDVISVVPESISSFDLKEMDGVELIEEGQIIKVLYNRKKVTLFINLDGGTGNSFITGKAGAPVSQELIGSIVKQGYAFDGFDRELPETFSMDDNNKTVAKVLWKSEGDARYGIKFYKQSKYSDEDVYYEAPELKIVSIGKTGDYTKVEYRKETNQYIIDGTPFDITGFHPVAEDSVYTFKNKEILGDETTVVEIYLDRNVVTYTIDFNGGHLTNDESVTDENYTISGRYEEFVVLPELEKTGYTRDAELWEAESIPLFYPAECPPEKSHVIAKWNVNHYTVKYDYNIPEDTMPLKNEPNPIKNFEFDEPQKNPAGWIDRAYHVFVGLNTKADGTGVQINPDDDILNLTDKDGDEVTLYCQWKPYKAPEFENLTIKESQLSSSSYGYVLSFTDFTYSNDESAYINEIDTFLYIYLDGQLVNSKRMVTYNNDREEIKEFSFFDSSKKYTVSAKIIYKYTKDGKEYILEGGSSPEIFLYSRLTDITSRKFVSTNKNSVKIQADFPESEDGFSIVNVNCNKTDGTSVTFDASDIVVPGQSNIIEIQNLESDTYYECDIYIEDKHGNSLKTYSGDPIKVCTTPELQPGEASVGQIYYDDDTWSFVCEEDKTPVGIILALNDAGKPTRIFSYQYMFRSYKNADRDYLGYNFGTDNKFNSGWNWPATDDLKLLSKNNCIHKCVAVITTIPGFETQRRLSYGRCWVSSSYFVNVVDGEAGRVYAGEQCMVIHTRDITY